LHPFRRRLAACALGCVLLAPLRFAGAADAPAPAPTIETGEIAGAKFAFVRPARWNRSLLLLAPGLRPADRPLVADLDPHRPATRTLVAEGWIVATTSYRRNGLIIGDAADDLDALREHLEAVFGAPERVILEGDSMGGLIVTLLAEREPTEPKRYHAAVAIDAALQLSEPNSTLGLTLQPRIPLLFLSNVSEVDAARNYVQAKPAAADPALRPVLFQVARSGHDNVNDAERLAALRAVTAWLDQGRAAVPKPSPEALFFDATVVPAAGPSRVAVHPDGRGFDAHVTAIDPAQGNVTLDAQPADFAAARIGRMSWFQLTAHGRTFRVLYGRDFDSVKRAEWVVFPDADGFVLLGRNRADAAAAAEIAVGDGVGVTRF